MRGISIYVSTFVITILILFLGNRFQPYLSRTWQCYVSCCCDVWLMVSSSCFLVICLLCIWCDWTGICWVYCRWCRCWCRNWLKRRGRFRKDDSKFCTKNLPDAILTLLTGMMRLVAATGITGILLASIVILLLGCNAAWLMTVLLFPADSSSLN